MIFTTPSAFKMLSFTPDHKVRKWVVKRISHDDDAPSLSAFLAWKSIEQKLPVDMTKTFPPSDLSLKLSNNKHPMKIMTVVKKILTIIFVNICTPRHAQQHSLRARALLFIEHTYRVLSDIQDTTNSNRIWCFEIV